MSSSEMILAEDKTLGWRCLRAERRALELESRLLIEQEKNKFAQEDIQRLKCLYEDEIERLNKFHAEQLMIERDRCEQMLRIALGRAQAVHDGDTGSSSDRLDTRLMYFDTLSQTTSTIVASDQHHHLLHGEHVLVSEEATVAELRRDAPEIVSCTRPITAKSCLGEADHLQNHEYLGTDLWRAVNEPSSGTDLSPQMQFRMDKIRGQVKAQEMLSCGQAHKIDQNSEDSTPSNNVMHEVVFQESGSSASPPPPAVPPPPPPPPPGLKLRSISNEMVATLSKNGSEDLYKRLQVYKHENNLDAQAQKDIDSLSPMEAEQLLREPLKSTFNKSALVTARIRTIRTENKNLVTWEAKDVEKYIQKFGIELPAAGTLRRLCPRDQKAAMRDVDYTGARNNSAILATHIKNMSVRRHP